MYKINFVNDVDFESLPGLDMGSKIGVAYPEMGEAYVRQSGAQIVDVFTAMHELEHLKGSDLDENYDSENKCYYKSFGQIMENLSPAYGASKGNFAPLAETAATLVGGPMAASAVGGMFGNGQPKQQQQPSPFDNSLMNQFDQSASQAPNVIQTSQGGGAGGGMSGSGFSPSGGLNGPQGEQLMQQFGNYSGRAPAMYNQGPFGTPIGGAA